MHEGNISDDLRAQARKLTDSREKFLICPLSRFMCLEDLALRAWPELFEIIAKTQRLEKKFADLPPLH